MGAHGRCRTGWTLRELRDRLDSVDRLTCGTLLVLLGRLDLPEPPALRGQQVRLDLPDLPDRLGLKAPLVPKDPPGRERFSRIWPRFPQI